MSADGQAFVEKHSPYTGTAYLIHLRMGMLANETHGYRLYSGDAYFAQLCRCSVKTLQRSRNLMVADGYLKLIRPATGRQVAEYEFLFLLRIGGHSDHPNKIGGHLVPNRWTSEESSPTNRNKYKESESVISEPVNMSEVRERRQRIMPDLLRRAQDVP